MAANRFLVLEYPNEDLLLGRFTETHPGSTVDIISEPGEVIDGDRTHPSVVLVKGARSADIDSIITALTAAHEKPTTVRRGDDFWLGRLRFWERSLQAPGFHALLLLQDRLGAPWLHMEEGVLHLRAQVREEEAAEKLAAEAETFLAAEGKSAQVTLEAVPEKDFGVWRDLVQILMKPGP